MPEQVASIIFAAGKGSRMTGYAGNKTLLPLVPGRSPFQGERPLLREVLENLPPGPRAIVVNHCASEVRAATTGPHIEHVLQPETNGTGGALLAAKPFLHSVETGSVVITMGDVPLIRPESYERLVTMLRTAAMAVLAFEPDDPAQYGMLLTNGRRVERIVEWKYWSDPALFPPEKRTRLKYCNAGVYAARRDLLLAYIQRLEAKPHEVVKLRNGCKTIVREYFLTDLVEMMHADGHFVAMATASAEEVIGVDTPQSLARVQEIYRTRLGSAHLP